MTTRTRHESALLGVVAAEWATIMIALAAAMLPAVLPLMVGVLTKQFGIGTELAGYVMSINMGGVLVGSLSCILLVKSIEARILVPLCLCIMVAGNAMSMFTTEIAPLIGTRLVSGWGEGVVGACCYSMMARAHLPARSIALYTGGQAIIGAASMALLPSLMAAYNWQAFYILVSFVAVMALFLTPIATRARAAGETADEDITTAGLLSGAGFGSLMAIFLFFVGIAMIWAFTAQLGVRQDLGLAQLSVALSASSIAGLGGSLVVGMLANRVRISAGLGIGMTLVLASLLLLIKTGFYPYMVAICGLSFAWAYQFSLLFACLAATDRGGRVALLTPLATGGALTIGPAIGGFVLAHGGVMMLCAGCLASTTAGTLLAAMLQATWATSVRLNTATSNLLPDEVIP